MASNRVQYGPLGIDTSRGPSGAIWGSCPWESTRESPGDGQCFWDDFNVVGTAPTSSLYAGGGVGTWSAYMAAGSQINDAQLEGGIIKLSDATDNEGITLLSQAGSFRMVTTSTLALNRKLWYECRIAKSTVVTAHLTCFAGLMKPTLSSGLPVVNQPLTTTDDIPMTAGDLFGFLLSGTTNATTGGTMTEVGTTFVLTSGTVNYPTNLQTLMASTGNTVLAADTYVKLGFIFDPQGPTGLVTAATARQTVGTLRKKIIRFFVNGVEAPTFLANEDVANSTATQAFPTAFMCPVFAFMNEASTSSDYMAIDWVRCCQMATL